MANGVRGGLGIDRFVTAQAQHLTVATVCIAGNVKGNAIEPGAESAAFLVTGTRLVKAQENLLAQVGGAIRAREARQYACHGLLPATNEGLESSDVSPPPAFHQLGIGSVHASLIRLLPVLTQEQAESTNRF